MTPLSTPLSTAAPVDPWSLEQLTRTLHYAASEQPPTQTATTDAAAAQEAIRREVKRLLEDPRTRAGVLALLRLHCRDWWMRACERLADLGPGASHVDIVSPPLGRDDFFSRYYCQNRPVALPGLARGWPAVSKWTADYLSQITATVDVMFNREQAPVHERSVPSRFQRSIPFAEYVRLVYSGRSTDDYYLVGKNHLFDVPEMQPLLDDIVCPPFAAIGDGDGKVSMWFGPAGTRTPIHYDALNTLLVQIAGRKVLRLYSPLCSAYMEQRQQWHGAVDPATADPARFPGGRGPTGTVVTLAPGDALFIPVGWWHVVEALDVSISLSFREFGALNDFGSALSPAVDHRAPQAAEWVESSVDVPSQPNR